ncbi:hypothetical protein ACIP4T_01270 [Streptomyces massasporeus]|uniref:hypothetical protein n=1 Tax=Streptomyces massasporeus TaxID=67324 RepID=UPI0036A96AD3
MSPAGRHEECVHPLGGPEPLLPADRPAVLAEVLGRDLRFHALSNEEGRAEKAAAGVPEAYGRPPRGLRLDLPGAPGPGARRSVQPVSPAGQSSPAAASRYAVIGS